MSISMLSLPVSRGMRKASLLNPEETVILRKGAQDGLKQSGLYKKGVRICRMHEVPMPKAKDMLKMFSEENLQKLANGLKNTDDSDIKNKVSIVLNTLLPVKYSKKDKKALDAIKEEINIVVKDLNKHNTVNMTKELEDVTKLLSETVSDAISKIRGLEYKFGLNAVYLTRANKIITPDKSLQTTVFHEMGHALNKNNKVIKTLSKINPIMSFIPGIVLSLALLNKRKTTDEKSDSKIQNFFDGLKKNAGILTAVAVLPPAIKEWSASLKGGKIAKNLFKEGRLSKTVLNKVRLTNLSSMLSYAIPVIGATMGVKAAITVKDKIQAKYEQKLEAKYQKKLEKRARKNNIS